MKHMKNPSAMLIFGIVVFFGLILFFIKAIANDFWSKEGFIEFNKNARLGTMTSVTPEDDSLPERQLMKLYDNLYYHTASGILIEIDGPEMIRNQNCDNTNPAIYRKVSATKSKEPKIKPEKQKDGFQNNSSNITAGDRPTSHSKDKIVAPAPEVDPNEDKHMGKTSTEPEIEETVYEISPFITNIYIKTHAGEEKTICGANQCRDAIEELDTLRKTRSDKNISEYQVYYSKSAQVDKYIVFLFLDNADKLIYILRKSDLSICAVYATNPNNSAQYIPDEKESVPSCHARSTKSKESFASQDAFTKKSYSNAEEVPELVQLIPKSKSIGYDTKYENLVQWNSDGTLSVHNRYNEPSEAGTLAPTVFPSTLPNRVLYAWSTDGPDGYKVHMIVTPSRTYIVAILSSNPTTHYVYSFASRYTTDQSTPPATTSGTTDVPSTETQTGNVPIGSTPADNSDYMPKIEFVPPPPPVQPTSTTAPAPAPAKPTTAQTISETTASTITNVADVAGTTATVTAAIAGGVSIQAIQSAEKSLSAISKVAGSTIDKTVDTAGNTVMKTVDTAGNTIVKTIDTAGNTITETVDSAGNTLTKTVDTAGSVLSGASDNLAGVANNAIDSIENMVTSTVGAFFSSVNKVTGEVFQLLGKGGERTSSAYVGSTGTSSYRGQSQMASSYLPQDTNPRQMNPVEHPYILYPDKPTRRLQPMPASYASISKYT